jgi:hypothetical protein
LTLALEVADITDEVKMITSVVQKQVEVSENFHHDVIQGAGRHELERVLKELYDIKSAADYTHKMVSH